MTALSLCLAACCLASAANFADAQQGADPRFRGGLTATVVPTNCAGARGTQVTLHWGVHSGATGYRVFVASAREGSWSPVPAASRCGPAHSLGPTALVELEPAPPSASRRLFYRVVAFGAAGPIDSTDIVPVDLAVTAATPARTP